MSIEQAKHVFSEIAKHLGIPGGTLNEQGMCKIRLAQKWLPSINVCYINRDNSLLFFAEVGQIPADKELNILRDLMHHQFLFSDSSGITFSLSPDTNSLTVQLKQDISLLDVHDFCETLRIFVQETADARIALFKEDDDENAIGANANNISFLRA